MLENICTDLETSKRLEELGLEIETKFFWYKNQYNKPDSSHYLVADSNPYVNAHASIYKAYTLEQLLNILPVKLPGAHESGSNHLCLKKDMWWSVGYPYNGTNCFQITAYKNEGLATIFGKLIIKLKEAKKI